MGYMFLFKVYLLYRFKFFIYFNFFYILLYEYCKPIPSAVSIFFYKRCIYDIWFPIISLMY